MRSSIAGAVCLLAALPAGTLAQGAPDLIFASDYETLPAGSCGNGIVEPPETCDLDCAICAPEVYPGFSSSGGPGTCDSRCHVPTQDCRLDQDDGTCPFIAGTGGSDCRAASDVDCTGPGWRSVLIGTANYTAGCHTLRVYGVSAGGSYVFTTCAPVGQTAGTGDPLISSVSDNLGRVYPLGANDDCTEVAAIPPMAGWDCRDAGGTLRMSCSTPSPGGFIAPGGMGTLIFFDVTVCPYNGPAGSGIAPFHVWFNAPAVPNPG